MPSPITIKEYQKFIGINNIKSPETLEPNELVEAINVDITSGGQIVSADNTEIDFTNADKNDIVFVNGQAYTCDVLSSLYSGNVGTKPFKCSGILEFYNGRFFSSIGNVIYISDPLDFGSMSIDGFIQVEEPIKNIRSVDDGLYISTTNELLFLSGSSPKEFRLKTIEKFNVIKNSMIKVPITIFGKDTDIYELLQTYYSKDGKIIVFLSEDGIYAGLNGGVIHNLTKGRYGKIKANSALVTYSNNKIYFKLLGG